MGTGLLDLDKNEKVTILPNSETLNAQKAKKATASICIFSIVLQWLL
jgi:hypothetical protein